jgi:hypothetical protein
MKALIPKIQDPIRPRKQLTTRQLVALFVMLALFVIAIWFVNYYGITGLFPLSFLNGPEIVLPPEMHSEEQTYRQVIDFIQSDDTETIPYGDGFNCVDASFRIWRNAYWQGITAYLIVILYNEPPGHMVIAFPTNDRGDIIIEPQSDLQIRPRVGQDYDERQVKGLYVFDCDPLPLDDSPPYDSDINAE